MPIWTRKALAVLLLGMACELPGEVDDPDFGVLSVTVAPSAITLQVDDSAQLGATVIMSNNRPPRSVSWATSNASVATVSKTGMVRGAAAGTVFVRATASANKRDSAAVTVVARAATPVASIAVAPASASLLMGATLALTATPKDAAGNVLTGRVVTWASSTPGVATISAGGLVTGVGSGTATLTATSEGKSGTATVTVSLVPVASLTVSPATAALRIGGTVQLATTVKDSAGNVLTGRSVTWTSGAPAVATVSATGLVSGIAAGSATITATSEGKSGTAAISVTLVPVATVAVAPNPASVLVGAAVQLTATVKDSAGNVLTGRSVTWSSGASAVATVSATGLVSGVAAGSATITATSEGRNGTAAVTVSVATPPPSVRPGYYVAPGGSSGGDGSWDRPWNLVTALGGAGGRIQPGDTVWLRGGTYRGAFTSTLRGASGAPIVVRAYPGERAIVDGTPSTSATFTIDGTWVVFWGFEITNTILERYNQRPAGVYVRNTSHVKLVNLVVHDVGMGTYTEHGAEDVEIYGCIYYNNGNQDGTRSNGHGVYLKNDFATPRVAADNVFFNMFGHGVHGYTNANSGDLANIVIQGNVAFNNGALSTYMNSNILLGGEEPVVNGRVSDNLMYFSPGVGLRHLRLGYSTIANVSIAATGNYAAGGGIGIEANYFGSATVSGNTVIGSGTMVAFAETNSTGWAWTANVQLRDPNAEAWARAGTAYTFSEWRAATGLGSSDQVSAATPSAPAVFVRANRYEAGRAHVVVYNWGRQGAVSVDLSGVLRVGQTYVVKNVQDLFGSPVASGTYGGGSVSLPMGGVAPPPPVGGSPVAPKRTGPDFDVFVVVPGS